MRLSSHMAQRLKPRTLPGVAIATTSPPLPACMTAKPIHALVDSAIEHPAAQFCAALSVDGFNDFYLPSLRELKALFANGCDAFNTDNWYWSSTQFSRYLAFSQNFFTGYTNYDDKDWAGGFARAVRRSSIESLID